MIVVLAVINLRSGTQQEVSVIAADVAAFCRGLPGCQRYDLALRPERSNTLLAAEVWTDAESFKAHIVATERAPELAAWRRMVGDVAASVYTAAPLELGEPTQIGVQD